MWTIKDWIMMLIVVVWITVVVVTIDDHTYQIPGTVQIAMAAVVSYLFGSRWLNNRDK